MFRMEITNSAVAGALTFEASALGDNKSLGGTVEAEIHLDGLLLKPTVTIDNKTVLVDKGKLMI